MSDVVKRKDGEQRRKYPMPDGFYLEEIVEGEVRYWRVADDEDPYRCGAMFGSGGICNIRHKSVSGVKLCHSIGHYMTI